MNTFKNIIIIIVILISTDIFAQGVQIGIFNDPPGTNQVQIKLRSSSAVNVLPSNLAFTIRYPSTISDLNFTPIWSVPFNTGTKDTFNINAVNSGYKYYSFFFFPDTLTQNLNWIANTDYQIVNLVISGGSGTTSFEVTNSLNCEADVDKFYFESDFSNMVNDTITPFTPGHSIVNNVSTVGIKTISTNIPDKYNLEQNYPNPFNPETNIKFDIPENSFTKLTIFDITGKEIATLVDEKLNTGSYLVSFNAINLASGVYFYKLVSGNFNSVKKMILMK